MLQTNNDMFQLHDKTKQYLTFKYLRNFTKK